MSWFGGILHDVNDQFPNAAMDHEQMVANGGADVVLLRPFGADTLLRGVAKALARPAEGAEPADAPSAWTAAHGLRL